MTRTFVLLVTLVLIAPSLSYGVPPPPPPDDHGAPPTRTDIPPREGDTALPVDFEGWINRLPAEYGPGATKETVKTAWRKVMDARGPKELAITALDFISQAGDKFFIAIANQLGEPKSFGKTLTGLGLPETDPTNPDRANSRKALIGADKAISTSDLDTHTDALAAGKKNKEGRTVEEWASIQEYLRRREESTKGYEGKYKATLDILQSDGLDRDRAMRNLGAGHMRFGDASKSIDDATNVLDPKKVEFAAKTFAEHYTSIPVAKRDEYLTKFPKTEDVLKPTTDGAIRRAFLAALLTKNDGKKPTEGTAIGTGDKQLTLAQLNSLNREDKAFVEEFVRPGGGAFAANKTRVDEFNSDKEKLNAGTMTAEDFGTKHGYGTAWILANGDDKTRKAVAPVNAEGFHEIIVNHSPWDFDGDAKLGTQAITDPKGTVLRVKEGQLGNFFGDTGPGRGIIKTGRLGVARPTDDTRPAPTTTPTYWDGTQTGDAQFGTTAPTGTDPAPAPRLAVAEWIRTEPAAAGITIPADGTTVQKKNTIIMTGVRDGQPVLVARIKINGVDTFTTIVPAEGELPKMQQLMGADPTAAGAVQVNVLLPTLDTAPHILKLNADGEFSADYGT